MQSRRLLFRVILKSLFLCGFLVLIAVFLNSLFTNQQVKNKVNDADNKKSNLVTLDISNMRKGQVRRVLWGAKEVAVLYRQFPEKLANQAGEFLQEDLHPSIKSQTRSKKTEYFVYFNIGDSRNCPLFYAAGEFKDVCSSNRFDEAGRDMNANQQSYMLAIPPHYFEQDTVIFGKWQP